MTICFTIDKSYCQHVAVVLASIARTNKGTDIHCFIIHNGISERDRCFINTTVYKSSITVKFVSLTNTLDQKFKVDGHVSVATYFRMYMPSILPPSIDKIIYLDCDLLVLSSLEDLWEIDVSNCAVAAVPSANQERINALNLPGIYYNCGIMIVNLEYWRNTDVQSKLIDYARTNSALLKFWDQDAINAVLKEQVLSIDQKWNYMGVTSPHSPVTIIHFAGVQKPWSSHFPMGQRKSLYFKFLKYTPYIFLNSIDFLKVVIFNTRSRPIHY